MPPRLLESSTAVAVNLISLLPTANADISTPRLRLLLFLMLKHFSLLIYVTSPVLLLLQHQLQCLLTPPRSRSQVSTSLRCLQSCYSSTSTCYPFLNMLPTSSAVTVPASDICIFLYIYRQHRALQLLKHLLHCHPSSLTRLKLIDSAAYMLWWHLWKFSRTFRFIQIIDHQMQLLATINVIFNVCYHYCILATSARFYSLSNCDACLTFYRSIMCTLYRTDLR